MPIELIGADGQDVVIRSTERFSSLPAHLADYYTTILAPSTADVDGTIARMIGTGPY